MTQRVHHLVGTYRYARIVRVHCGMEVRRNRATKHTERVTCENCIDRIAREVEVALHGQAVHLELLPERTHTLCGAVASGLALTGAGSLVTCQWCRDIMVGRPHT